MTTLQVILLRLSLIAISVASLSLSASPIEQTHALKPQKLEVFDCLRAACTDVYYDHYCDGIFYRLLFDNNDSFKKSVK